MPSALTPASRYSPLPAWGGARPLSHPLKDPPWVPLSVRRRSTLPPRARAVVGADPRNAQGGLPGAHAARSREHSAPPRRRPARRRRRLNDVPSKPREHGGGRAAARRRAIRCAHRLIPIEPSASLPPHDRAAPPPPLPLPLPRRLRTPPNMSQLPAITGGAAQPHACSSPLPLPPPVLQPESWSSPNTHSTRNFLASSRTRLSAALRRRRCPAAAACQRLRRASACWWAWGARHGRAAPRTAA